MDLAGNPRKPRMDTKNPDTWSQNRDVTWEPISEADNPMKFAVSPLPSFPKQRLCGRGRPRALGFVPAPDFQTSLSAFPVSSTHIRLLFQIYARPTTNLSLLYDQVPVHFSPVFLSSASAGEAAPELLGLFQYPTFSPPSLPSQYGART